MRAMPWIAVVVFSIILFDFQANGNGRSITETYTDSSADDIDQTTYCFMFPAKCLRSPTRIIWMYWDQGEEHLQQSNRYNYLCVTAWRDLNPTWTLHFLDNSSRKLFVPDIEHYSYLPIQKQADILRLMLLIKYGGVWADVSVLPLQPLNSFIQAYASNAGSLFLYKYVNHTFPELLISNWLIYTPCSSHPALSEWLLKILYNLHDQRKTDHYFATHHALGQLYNYGPELVRCVVDALSIDSTPAHSFPSDLAFNCEDATSGRYPAMLKRANYSAGSLTFPIFRQKYVRYVRTCFDSGWFLDEGGASLHPSGHSLTIPVYFGSRLVHYTHHHGDDIQRRVTAFCDSVCVAFGVTDDVCASLAEHIVRDILSPRDPNSNTVIG